MYILFHILFRCGLSQDTEHSSLCYTAGLCGLSILYILVCHCWSPTPNPSLPQPPPPRQPQVCSLCLLSLEQAFLMRRPASWHIFKSLPYDPAIPLPGIYPEKTRIQKESCTTMFTAALFTMARTWKQPKCPSTDEWIKKMWHIYTMEYYSAIKRNETELFVVRRMDLETVIQREVSQKEKNKYRMLTHIYGI